MDQSNVTSVKPADVAKNVEIADIPLSTRRESELPVLEEWEMVLAGGGETVVCW